MTLLPSASSLKPSPNLPSGSQRGVALLTILLLVVSITIVAGAMLASQKTAIRRHALLFDQNQLLQGIQAGQQLALTVIRADSQLNDTDSIQDIWAQPLPPYALDNHSVTAELRDEASRFNINNLYYNGKVDTVALAVFQRLLTQLNLEPEIAVAVLDWQDADNEVYGDGGDEDLVYRQQNDNSIQTIPNQPLVSIEQLQEVQGVSAEVLAALRPYITAVPYFLPINVNTASPVLLAALIEEATPEQMQTLIKLREQQGLTTIDELWQVPPLSILNTEQRQALTPLLAVESQAFMALITASDNSHDHDTAPRQKFATVLISKVPDISSSDNNNGSNADNNGMSSANSAANDEANQPKTIKILSQRLWAFRPVF